jgi:hypothetical protein
MRKSKQNSVRFEVWQPLSWQWPYGVPKRLRLGIWAKAQPKFPKAEDPFLRWALSGAEVENLNRESIWLCLKFSDTDSMNSPRTTRALELIRNTQLAIQILAPVGCSNNTMLIRREDSGRIVSTVHTQPLVSTPWGRINAFGDCSLSDIRRVVSGVHGIFHSQILRLVNPLYWLQLGLESKNNHIRTFQWVSGLDSLLMAGNSNAFRERLVNVHGDKTFVLPKVGPDGQPKYSVEEVAEDLYGLRSVTAHGQLIPKKFLEFCEFTNTLGAKIPSYPFPTRYFNILEECALFLFVGVLRKIFMAGLVKTFIDVRSWRQKLRHPF